jgi:DNA polymerase III sliding clamp (beta) subunit (PCNA family)
VSGSDVKVAFNPAHLAWSLAVTPAAEIVLGFQADLGKPALVSGSEGLRHLLMPVRLP